MTLSIQNQIKNQIEAAESILVLTKPKASSDAVAASWGIYHLLESLGKKPTILETNLEQTKLNFLKVPDKMEKALIGSRDFVLSFNTTRNKIIDFRTENKLETFDIYITPEKETIDPRDFSFIPAKFKYDLLIVLGCQNLEALGELRDKNADLFFEVPIVNIDNSGANENFGQVNLVDITASSLSEITAGLAKEGWEKFAGSAVAQCLLTGLISATSNFQNKNTTPQTFLTASWLIEKGADQQEIIRHLMKTQSFSFMKLWGRVMARLNWDENKKLAWSLVTLEDFVQSRSKPADLPIILEKIKNDFSAGRFFAVLYSESLERSVALIRNSENASLKDIQKTLGGEFKNGHLEIIFEGKNVVEAEKELLEKIK